MDGEVRFADRTDAGRRLAALLSHYERERPLVVGLPRGGVPVAAEVADAMDAPLETLVVRKLGTPGHEELAMGAIGPGGERVLNEPIIQSAGVGSDDIARVERNERAELESRERRFRGDRAFPDVNQRTVILVDDGIATGSTAKAAIEVLRSMGAKRIVLAVPILPAQATDGFRGLVDDLVYVYAPDDFTAVGRWYKDFRQTTNHEVVEALRERGGRAADAPSIDGARRAAPTVGTRRDGPIHRDVEIPIEDVLLLGRLDVPDDAVGLVLFAHGSGSSRSSPRNRAVAESLQRRGIATLLFDLLTEDEEKIDRQTAELRFDLGLLARRLLGAARWVRTEPDIGDLPRGYFGSSTGGGAALLADASEPDLVSAVVSRGGRPDLAGAALVDVQAPTLLIVGGEDRTVLQMNRSAMDKMRAPVRLETVPGATHLFEEPGALEQVQDVAGEWFLRIWATPHEALSGTGRRT